MKKKVLFIMHMPPPVHGAAMVGQWIHDSRIINESFDTYYINPSVSSNVSEVGKVSILKLWLFLKLLFNIIITILKVKPDLCYYTPTSDGWGIYRDALTISLIKILNRKVILHFHNKGVKEYSRNIMAHYTYKIIFHKVKVILIAKQLYDDVERYISMDDVYFLPNGLPASVDETSYNEYISNRASFDGPIRLLYLSNMMKEKGIIVLLDACKLLKDSKLPFSCDFVGNWGNITAEEFRKKINERKLQTYVKISGPQYGLNKQKYFIDSDIFIFPSFYHGETFGLVLLEAMEYGLPCISTYEGGIPSVIKNGKTGILVKQKNVKELYDAIVRLIMNKDMRYSMGCEGRNLFLKDFKLEIFENRLMKILSEVSNGR